MKLVVTVAYGAPGVEHCVEVALSSPATVGQAAAASGLIENLQLDASTLRYAIYGQRAEARTPLRDGDRVELTRPLVIDPKSARRVRAAKVAR